MRPYFRRTDSGLERASARLDAIDMYILGHSM